MTAVGRTKSGAKTVGPLTRVELRAAAIRHLERFPTTRRNVRAVLERRIERATRRGREIPGEAPSWFEGILAELEAARLLDDALFARLRVASLRRAGASSAKIAAKLAEAGVPGAVTAGLLEAEGAADELRAAVRYAQRRRLGPYRAPRGVDMIEEDERAVGQRELAALSRAGFSFAIARRVLSGEAQQALDEDDQAL